LKLTLKVEFFTKQGEVFLTKKSFIRRCRRMYWSDCSGPVTIQTARLVDGGD